jgi:hypothetical protein
MDSKMWPQGDEAPPAGSAAPAVDAADAGAPPPAPKPDGGR